MKKAIIIDSTLAQYTAEDISWLQKFFLQQGVLGDSAGSLGLAVSQRGAGANLSVDVAVGNALIDFTKNSTNWKIIGLSNAIENVVVPTQSSGANRVGALIMRASTTIEPNLLKNNIITFEFVPGTSTSPLSDGAILTAISNDAFIRLADITVPTGASSIVTGNIADTRVQCKTNEAITLAPKNLKFTVQASDPASPVEGQIWYNSTTHTLNFYNNSVVKSLGGASSGFNPFVTTQQSSPDMTLLVGAGEVRIGDNVVHYAGGNSPAFLNPAFAYDIELALNPTNGETIVITINGTPITINWVSSIGAAAGNLLIQGTVAASRAALVNFLLNPGVTNANQVAFSAPNQALLAYISASDDTTLKAFVYTISSSLTSLSMSETMAGAGNVVTANTTKNRVDILFMNSSGALEILRGAYSASPVAPNYPPQAIMIAEVYCRRGMTSVKTTDDSTNGYISRDIRGFAIPLPKFGGTGADGDLYVAAGTLTIDLAGAQYFEKNYKSITITGTGSVNFINPHANGSIIIIKCQRDAVITSSNPGFDTSGMGAQGGASQTVQNTAGNPGSLPTIINGVTQTASFGLGGATGGGSGKNGSIYVSSGSFTVNAYQLNLKQPILLAAGAGGGSGSVANGGSGVSGAGGRGGGGLYMEIAGAINFTGSIKTSGLNGADGTGNSGSGGGGGSAGTVIILYNVLISVSGTLICTGGNGGTSVNSGYGNSGGGGAGSALAAGGDSAGGSTNGFPGSLGSGGGGTCNFGGTARTGGAGGPNGASIITKNNFY